MSLPRRASCPYARPFPAADSKENLPSEAEDRPSAAPPRTPLTSIPDPSQKPPATPSSSRSVFSRPSSTVGRCPAGPSRERAHPCSLSRAANLHQWPLVEAAHFELQENPSFWEDHNVQVLIRIRPISSMEIGLQGDASCLRQESSKSIIWSGSPEARFTFDHIACESISQEKLFKVVGVPMVENCMSGYNSCMFAYGQTGSGKTYTLMGEISNGHDDLNEDRGMTPRIFEYLFRRIKEEEDARLAEKLRFSCKCSFLEIYNEQITDLLDPSSTNLQLREDLKKGVYVENLREFEVYSVKDVIGLLLQGSANRKVAATYMNSESSRSHSLFTCTIESSWEKDAVTHLRFSRLNLVDLAGSERQKSSGAEGERLKEAANMNRSLSTLGLVIMSLVDLANGKNRHVPYRDSRLTFLLQDSLGGNSKTTIIANVSPSICSASETLSILKFAQRAKLIQNNAKVNENSSGDILALQRQIRILKEKCFESSTCDVSRREKMAEDAVKRLEMDNQHKQFLICQLEDEINHSNTMIRIRDEKIRRLEALANGLVASDKYLIDENDALSEENHLLIREKSDKNPESSRLTLENLHLREQLRMIQEFSEQTENGLLAEISALRTQLMKVSRMMNWQSELSTGTAELDDNLDDLRDLKRKLDASLGVNARLKRENDDLHVRLKHLLPEDPTLDTSTSSEDLHFIDAAEYDSVAFLERPVECGGVEDSFLHTDKKHIGFEETGTLNRHLLLDHAKMMSDDTEVENNRWQVDEAAIIVHRVEEAGVSARGCCLSSGAVNCDMKIEYRNLQDRFHSISEENCRLLELLAAREAEISAMSKEWEKAVLDLTNFLIDGRESLEDASDQIGFIMDSFPQQKTWVNKRIERAIKVILEKERLIVCLQKRLEGAQKMGLEISMKLRSLQGATLAVTECQHLENTTAAKEVHLMKLLDEKNSRIRKLESMVQSRDSIADVLPMEAVELKLEEVSSKSSVREQNFLPDVLSTQEDFVKSEEIPNLFVIQMEKSEPYNCRTSEVLHARLNNAMKFVDAKSNEPCDFIVKFANSQKTFEEADAAISSILNFNDNILPEKDRGNEESLKLLSQKKALLDEIEELKLFSFEIGENHVHFRAKMKDTLDDLSGLLSLVEVSFPLFQEYMVKTLKVMHSDILSFGHGLFAWISDSRSCIESLLSDIVRKNFSLFVVYQCYFGAFGTRATCNGILPLIHCNDDESSLEFGKYSSLHPLYESSGCVHESLNEVQKCNKIDVLVARDCMNKVSCDCKSLNRMGTGDRGMAKSGEKLVMMKSQEYTNNPMETGPEIVFSKSELSLRNDLSSALLVDFCLLQESLSNTSNVEDEAFSALSRVRFEMESKTKEIDDLLVKQNELQLKLNNKEALLDSTLLELNQAYETFEGLLSENSEFRAILDKVSTKKLKTIDGIQREFLYSNSLEKKALNLVEQRELSSAIDMRDHVIDEIDLLKDKLESALALADENEAIAVEARQVAEKSKMYAEQKEQEVKVLDKSVMELEETINVLERKVLDMLDEVEFSRKIREDLEKEVQSLRHRIRTLESAGEIYDVTEKGIGQGGHVSSQVEEIMAELLGARKQIVNLETEKETNEAQIKQYKAHIAELVLHSEAQSSLYQKGFKKLEAMVQEAKGDASASNIAGLLHTAERGSARTRRSGSPFRCISNIVQQMNSEKDQELFIARHQIEELKAVVSSHQKQIFTLTTRLAEVDNMTHDVIRDLLEVKVDMTNYANAIDHNQLQNLLSHAYRKNKEDQAKEKEIETLRKQIEELVNERDSWIDEINRIKAEDLQARILVERIQRRDQLLIAQNEMLKMDKANLTEKIMNMDAKIKILTGSSSMNELMQKQEIVVGPSQQVEEKDLFSRRLAEADKHLVRNARTKRKKPLELIENES